MSFLTGYFLGGASRQWLDTTDRATRNFVDIVHNRFAGPTWQDHHNELLDVALQWQSHSDQWQRRAEWLEAEVERLKAIR